MNLEQEWLIDRSALARVHTCADAIQWLERVQRGLVHITTPTLLEVGFSGRSEADWRNLIEQPPVALMPVENATPLISPPSPASRSSCFARAESDANFPALLHCRSLNPRDVLPESVHRYRQNRARTVSEILGTAVRDLSGKMGACPFPSPPSP